MGRSIGLVCIAISVCEGRRWLAELELPVGERLTVDGCLRQLDFLGEELARADRMIAEQAEAGYRRLISDWQAAWPERVRARHRSAHLEGPRRAKAARQASCSDACTSSRQSPAAASSVAEEAPTVHPI